mgnify:FL=1
MPSAARSALRQKALNALFALHREIDREADRLSNRHGERLQCGRGCSACCLDDLTVTTIEAERIRNSHPELIAQGTPRAPGGCAFLDDTGACRVYEDRPSVCRTQGLPLRVFGEDEDEEIFEHRDICSLNLDGGPPLDSLDEDDCWLVGPFDLRLAALDESFGGDDESRVALRSLFARTSKDATE